MDDMQKLLKRNSLILWDAIKRDDLAKMQEILDKGFPVDHFITDSDLTALMFACTRSVNLQLFQLLLQRGPDVNKRGQGGKTALHFAAISGNIVALQLVLKVPSVDKNP